MSNFFSCSGIGFDVHAFDRTEELGQDAVIILGGVEVKSPYAIIAHSDGDVVFHAVTDAILGAISGGSIGVLFPDVDARWKNADSRMFLSYAKNLVEEKNAKILHIDVTVICQIPKIMPYANTMQKNIAEILDISAQQVNIKAVTTEYLGFIGRKEGIATQAICTVLKSMNLSQ